MKFYAFLLFSIFAVSDAVAAVPEVKEFTSGQKTKFSTLGHPKAKGANLTISYPNSWVAKEGDRPNIVQKFVGPKSELVTITTKALPEKPTPEELKDFLSPETLKELVPEGGKILETSLTKLDGAPAGMISWSVSIERAGISLEMENVAYVLVVDSTMVIVSGMVGSQKGANPTAKDKMAEYRPLFTLMAGSVILPDQWK